MLVDLPPDHPVTVLHENVRTYLVGTTPVGLQLDGAPPRITVSTTPLGGTELLTAPDAVAWPTPRLIAHKPSPAALVNTAVLAGARAKLNEGQSRQLLLVIHEQLHIRTHAADALNAGGSSAQAEEAAVDAVALDLLPAVSHAITGNAVEVAPGGPYAECVARIRVASTVATQSRNWSAPAAASWRMRLLMADRFERDHMLLATGTHPDHVC